MKHDIPRIVLLKRFCELYGYSRDAVYGKIKNGVWADGIHYRKAPDGNYVIYTEEVERWLEGQEFSYAANQ